MVKHDAETCEGVEKRPVIALLTDFGYHDGYAGTMKGVIASIAPHALVIDITHGVRPQSITGASLILWGSYRYFPHGTIFCVVVDPTVGTERYPIVVRTRRYTFVGPNNGVMSWAFDDDGVEVAIKITNRRFMMQPVSQTFHGRDVFAPVAGHIACGVELHELGDEIPEHELKRLPRLSAKRVGDKLVAEVVHIDWFGNAITSLHLLEFEQWLADVAPKAWKAKVKGVEFERLSKAYGDVPAGEPLIIFNSYGLLEVAVNCGNASDELGIKIGDEVVIEPM
jgi:S-adenosylmethionine hydrolase